MEASKVGEGSLPEGHEDQLQLGVRIITSAFENKMHSLEQEIRGLRMTCEEQRGNVAGLQKKNSALEVELVEGHQRAQALAEENKELFKTVNSLRKQIERLEGLKRAVLRSMQDDQEKEAELGDSRLFMSEEFLKGATPLTAAELGYGTSRPKDDYSWGGQPGQSAGVSVPGTVPQTPVAGFEPTAAAPAAANAGGSVVDGKLFFRRARSCLSYEAFNLFLASIKRLNNQQATREDTLAEAKSIFGEELADLYTDFESLLNRHGM